MRAQNSLSSMETLFIIALTSFTTAFFSNLLAPRLNAWFDQRQQNKKILKRTLRTLLEIEVYIQRRVKHPSLTLFTKEFDKSIKKLKGIDKEQISAFNEGFSILIKNQIIFSQLLPDNSDALEKEFSLVLTELSAVDPLLVHRIRERHIITPIQQIKDFAVQAVTELNMPISEADFQGYDEFINSLETTKIDETMNNLRSDILLVARKAGRRTLWKIASYYLEQAAKREKKVKIMTAQLFDELAKNIEVRKNESRNC